MMPTRSSSTRTNFIGEDNRLTDDLPVCKESGIGSSTNCIYREDGLRQQEHEYEDQSFHFRCSEKTCMYGIFDGHDGYEVAKNALDTIAAEVLINQLGDKTTDEDVKNVLKLAFNAVERNYNASIDDKLAEKASLQMEIPENLTPYEAYQHNPRAVDRLNAINTELSCGTSAVVALTHLNRLYVANVGDSRALLCRTDQDGVLRVIQLSQDHVLSNDDEILRLNTLGIPRERIMKGFRLGSQEHTRCLGHYLVKGGYIEFEELASACSEPVTADPEITGGIPLEGCHRFIILMSSGLYRSLEEATGTEYVNKDIVQMVVEQFRIQSTLTGVAQAVVDKVVRIHHDFYMSRTGSDRIAISKREDITLLIRNFNFPLPNARSPSCSNVIFNPSPEAKKFDTSSSATGDADETNDTEDLLSRSNKRSPLLPSGRIAPYVNFRPYHESIEKARLEGSLPEDIEFSNKITAEMETSDKDDNNQSLRITLAATNETTRSASPLANAKSATDEEFQLEFENPLKNEADGSSAEQFDPANEVNDMLDNIVMSPADFVNIVEETNKQLSPQEKASIESFRLDHEKNIQLSTIETNFPDTNTNQSYVKESSTEKVADQLGKPAKSEDQEEEIDRKSVADAAGSQTSDDPEAEILSKIRRRNSMFLSDDLLKKESLESYKIGIPLRKKVNKSTRKKLWREIERRKPFITQNVIEHIRTYAKPPFITWGCRNCEYLYERES